MVVKMVCMCLLVLTVMQTEMLATRYRAVCLFCWCLTTLSAQIGYIVS